MERELQRELRRNQNTMIVLGAGVIAFGVWTIIKAGFYYFFSRRKLLELLELSPLDPDSYVTAYMVVVAFLVVDMMVRLYVGLSARAEGKGKKRGMVYVVLCGFLAITSVTTLVYSVIHYNVSQSGLADVFVALVVDFTSAATLVELILACLRVKRLSRQLSQ